MRISNTFDVPLPPDQAWRMLLDIPTIVPCMPGAELLEKIDDRSYKGKVAVRLGPVALAFTGVATFEEVDDSARTARVKAGGTDPKGRGGANAIVTFSVEPKDAGSKVSIDSDVNLSGSVAQYGRGSGMIQGVATQLISQFAKNLEAQITSSKVAPEPQTTDAAAGEVSAAPVAKVAKPVSGFSLIFKTLWAGFAGLFKGQGRGGQA